MDESTEAASSAVEEQEIQPEAAEPGATEVSTDTPAAEATPTAEKSQDAKSAPEAQPKSVLDAAMAAMNKVEGAAEPSDAEAAKSEAAAKEPEKTDTQAPDKAEADDAKLPFNKHPRFQQVIRERREFKTQAETVQKQLEQWKPLVEDYNAIVKRVQDAELTTEEFGAGFNIMAAMKHDPFTAKKLLQPYWDRLCVATGDVLPEDLKKRVDDGVTDETQAKEAARLRAETANSNAQLERERQKAAATQEQNHRASLVNSVQSWTATKAKSDPDFERIQTFVQDRFGAMWQEKPPKSVAEAVALCEAAYAAVKQNPVFKPSTPKPAVKPPPNSAGTSGSPNAVPRSSREAGMLAQQRMAMA